MKEVLNKRRLGIVLSILLSLGSFMIVYYALGCSYVINDDRYMAEIISGCITGEPNSHAVFIHYFLGLVLSTLYSVTTKIPWYGLFLALCMITSFIVIFYGIIRTCKKLIHYFYSVLCCCIIMACCFYFFACFQFTAISGILGVAGYFWLLIGKREKKDMVIFIVLETMSYFVRYESMLFVQPIGLVTCAALFFAENREFPIRNKITVFLREMLKLVGIVAAIVGIAWSTNAIGYDTEEWREYLKYNVARSYIEDYCTGYSHDVIADVLNEYDISEEQFDLAFKMHWCVGNHLRKEGVISAVEVLKENSSSDVDLRELIYRTLTFGKYDDIKGFYVYNYLLYLVVILAVALQKKWGYLVPIFAVYSARFILLFYLIYKERYPFRVTSVLFFSEMILLCVVLLKNILTFEKTLWKRCVVIAVGTMCSLICLYTSKAVWQEVKELNSVNAAYSEDMYQLIEYLADMPGGCIIDISSMMNFPGEVFDSKWYEHKDILISGGWFSNTPFMMEYEQDYFERYGNDLSIVSSAQGEKQEYFCSLVEAALGVSLESVGGFVTENEEEFIVYRIAK